MKIESLLIDETILKELGKRIAQHRLNNELTQADLAREAGIAKRTIERIETGKSTQTSTFIRVLRVLELLDNLNNLIPESNPHPMGLLKHNGKQRKRAASRPKQQPSIPWQWDDES